MGHLKIFLSKKYTLPIFLLILFIALFFAKVHNRVVDFPAYYTAAERFLNIDNLYELTDRWPYKYLPAAAMLFTPLALFPYSVAIIIFYLLSVSALLYSYKLLIKLSDDGVIPKLSKWGWVLLILIMNRFHLYDFANLQVNHFFLLLLILSAISLFKKKGMQSSLFLTLAGIFKIIPLAMTSLYALQREWKALIWTALFLIIALFLPFIFYGIDDGILLYAKFQKLMSASHSFFASDRIYQSIPSLVGKFFVFLNYQVHEMLLYKWLLFSFLLTLTALPLFLHLFYWKIENSPKKRFIEFITAINFIILVNPVGWRHALVMILPSLYFVIALTMTERGRLSKLTLGLLIFTLLLTSQFIVGKSLGHLFDELSMNTVGVMMLTIMTPIFHFRSITSRKI